jgi:hypothetical protein
MGSFSILQKIKRFDSSYKKIEYPESFQIRGTKLISARIYRLFSFFFSKVLQAITRLPASLL